MPSVKTMRSERGREGRSAFLAAACGLVGFVALAGAQGCGGASPSAKVPEKTSYADAGAGQAVETDQGQVVAVATGVAGAAEDMPGDARDAYNRGFQAWAAGDLQGAKSAFTDAASKAPKAGSPRYSLGCVLERLGDTQGALDAYRLAYSTNSKLFMAAGAYAVLLARTGKGPDAESYLSDKRSSSPDSVQLMAYNAEVKSIEGDSPGCQKIAQDALTKQPDFKDAMIVIARDYYRARRWDLAKYALQAILDGADDGSIPPRDKGNGEALLLRALIERDTPGQRKQALTDLAAAIVKRPDLFEAYVNLGEMKLEAGNATEAQPPLEKAVRYAPNVAVAHEDLGECYRLLGRPGDAKKEYDTALSLESTMAGAHYDLGLLYLFSQSVPGVASQDDQLAKAIQEFETFKSMRGAKVGKGPGDDVDDLLANAKRKQSELNMKKQAAAQAAAAPPPAASGAPAGSAAPGGAAAPAGSAAPAASAPAPTPAK
jgi:tetratricopeptide (TPR) repeat protein